MPWTIEYTETALTQLRKFDKRTARRIVASSMNAEQLLTHFDRLADAPDAIPRLRRFILDLAVRGKLVEQDPEDEPAGELLKRIAAEKRRLVEAGEIKKSKAEWVKVADPSFDLPDSWQWDALGNLFLYDAGIKREPKALNPELWLLELEDVEKDTGRLLARITVAERESKSTKSEFRVDDILYGKLRPYLNKALVADKPGYSTTEIVALRPCIPLCSKYCALALLRPDFVNYVTQLGQGTKMPRLRTEDAVVAPFPLPPLAEQHRIVAKVDELMALCDRLETARKEREATRDRLVTASLARLNAPDPDPAVFQNHAAFALNNLTPLTTRPDQIKALRQTILNLAVRGKLVEQDPEDEPAGELVKQAHDSMSLLVESGEAVRMKAMNPLIKADELFPGPKSWQWVRLGELSKLITKGSSPKWQGIEYVDEESGILFITSENVGNYTLTKMDKPKYVEARFNQIESRSILQKGDILLNLVGASIGRSAVFNLGCTANINQAVALIRPIHENVHIVSSYLLHYLNSSVCINEMLGSRVINAQPNISLTDTRNFLVPLPPLAEQHRIVAKVDKLMAVCDRLEASLARGDETRRRLVEAVLWGALETGGNR